MYKHIKEPITQSNVKQTFLTWLKTETDQVKTEENKVSTGKTNEPYNFLMRLNRRNTFILLQQKTQLIFSK